MTSALPLITGDLPPLGEDEAGFGCLRGAGGPLPLVALSADGRIDGLLWQWSMRQEFRNSHPDTIEAIYIFPLPPRGAVTAFRLRIGERCVEGRLGERAQARTAFLSAMKEGHRAALLEEDRPNVFTIQVGNIGPGERVVVELTVSGQVAVDAGYAEVRLPLVVAPRYIPGSAIGDDVGAGVAGDTDVVPDASRISPPVLLPGFPNPVRLAIAIAFRPGEVAAGDPTATLPVVVDRIEADGARLLRVVPGQRLDRDLVVRWPVRAGALVVSGAGVAHGDESTIALTIAPPAPAGGRRPLAVVTLLDRSGSMRGWKMVAARRAAARLVDGLDRSDRFAVIAFDDRVELPPGPEHQMREGLDRERFAAVSWLAGLEPRGGTELDQALARALELLRSAPPSHERVLVLVTDGQVGDEDRLLREHAVDLAVTRVVALGIDSAVNESLLARLAAGAGGWWACVESEEWLDAVLAEAHRRVQPPVLTEVEVAVPGLVADGVVPQPVPQVGGSGPLTLLARCTGRPEVVTVRARLADGTPWSREVPVTYREDAAAIRHAWARGRIRALEDGLVAGRGRHLEQAIVAFSLAENVLSRFTAFLAVDTEKTKPGLMRTIVQAVESVMGWEAAGGVTVPTRVEQNVEPYGVRHAMSVSRRVVAPKLARLAGLSDLSGGGRQRSSKRTLTDLLRDLSATWERAGQDPMRRALTLNGPQMQAELQELITALLGEERFKELGERLLRAIRSMKPPAPLPQVIAELPLLVALFGEIEAAVGGPPAAAGGGRRDERFWSVGSSEGGPEKAG